MLIEDKLPHNDDWDGMTLDDVRKNLDTWEEKCIKLGAVGEVKIDYDFHGYDGAYEVWFVFQSEESGKEKIVRLEQERKAKERKQKSDFKKREKELRELKRLKNKYEKDT